jgi:hypothetical protein
VLTPNKADEKVEKAGRARAVGAQAVAGTEKARREREAENFIVVSIDDNERATEREEW